MPDIFLLDTILDPQDEAMLQALYSRSPESARVHAEKVKQVGSGKFMGSFYVGYGHKSIGDCGSTTLFIEGVSMLDAKAVEDHPLYSGQETSTRYIDMGKQPIEDPIGTYDAKKIQVRWMEFYLTSQEEVASHLRAKYPRNANEDEKVYEKAIKARVFDILRGFLPAGIVTQFSWHTNLRQAADKLFWMRHHPVQTIRERAEKMHAVLFARYPESFGHKRYEASEAFAETVMKHYTYFDPGVCPDAVQFRTTVSTEALEPYVELLASRPRFTEPPHFLLELGQLTFDLALDFGSFRDLQRHRNGVCRMPLLTTKYGFHSWYLEQLPPTLMAQARALLATQEEAIAKLGGDPLLAQYYVAMGYRVPCRVTYGLPAALYTIELRSGKTVHPTLRQVAHEMARHVATAFPGIAIHADLDADDWDVRRGNQDIIQKAAL